MEVPAIVFEILAALSQSVWQDITTRAMPRDELLSLIRDSYLNDDSYTQKTFSEGVFAMDVTPEPLVIRQQKFVEFEGCLDEPLLNKHADQTYTFKTIEQLT